MDIQILYPYRKTTKQISNQTKQNREKRKEEGKEEKC